MINRAQLRGKPLDADCKQAYTSTHEYGAEDDRVFCFGLIEGMSICDVEDKCKECKAYVYNAEPWEGGE